MAVDFFYPAYEVVRNQDRCITCRVCERQCANKVHQYDAELGLMISDESACVNCQRCVLVCPVRALKIVKSDCAPRENANWDADTVREVYKQAASGGVLLSSMGNPKPMPIYWDKLLLNASQVTNPSIDPLREPMETRVFLGKKPSAIRRDAQGRLDCTLPPQLELSMPVLDERLFNSPAVAIQQAKSAVETMARNARANYGEAVPVLYSHNTEVLNLIQQRESVIDKLEVNISNYLVKVTDRELNESESHAVNELINFIVEYERIGDYAINVVERSGEMFDKEITFSESARRELSLVDNAIKEIMDITLAAFQADDTVLAEQVEPLEETIDLMIDTLRERHILRLKNGVCAIESGIIFLEILTNLERISDHCSNIAGCVLQMKQNKLDLHGYLDGVRTGSRDFADRFDYYARKYALAEGGAAWVAEPSRAVYDTFRSMLVNRRWAGRCVWEKNIEALYPQERPVPVRIWEIHR